jgi:citrate synthase
MAENRDAKARYIYPHPSTAFTRGEDTHLMPSKGMGRPSVSDQLYEGYSAMDEVSSDLFDRLDVKRGLRNSDGSGVLVGLTTVSSVHGYNKVDGVVSPDRGHLTLRGYQIDDLVNAAQSEGRFGYEEVAYLLLSGSLPTAAELDDFKARIGSMRQLPEGFFASFPHRTYSHSIMNVLQRVTLKLYAYDPIPDDTAPEHEIDIALSLLGRWPRAAAVAHAAYAAGQEGERKLVVPPANPDY